jgi:argonaute-like protein implicated in RNA metabolism and viral defense
MPGDVDCFVGLDATRDPDTGQFLGASANVVLADGTVFVSKTQSIQSGETFDENAVIDILKDVHREYVRAEGEPPESIVIHRDGRLFEDSEAILEPFQDSGIDIDILDIRKSGAPRAAIWRNGNFKVDQKGRLFIAQSGDFGFLSTTGKPEFDDSDGLGTPRTLRVVRRAGDTPMATLLKQVYWLSESHVGSAQRSIRLPVTTYYADTCAEHARKGYLTNGELIRGVPYI